ncbi:hypothetical protein L6R46_21265 [Myxococcota bacterium]|nr:hypothetical protein [Myxococcota bacterium]
MAIDHLLLITDELPNEALLSLGGSANVSVSRVEVSAQARELYAEDYGIRPRVSFLLRMNKLDLDAGLDELLSFVGTTARHLSGPALLLAHCERPWLHIDPVGGLVQRFDGQWSESADGILQASLGVGFRTIVSPSAPEAPHDAG